MATPSTARTVAPAPLSATSPITLIAYPPGAMLRVDDITTDRQANRRGLLPIARRTWLRWVELGIVPPGIKIGFTRAWPIEVVLEVARNGISEQPAAAAQVIANGAGTPAAPAHLGLAPRVKRESAAA